MRDETGQLAAAFAPLEEGEEEARREQAIIRVFPANIGFRPERLARCKAEFRLADEEQVVRIKGEVDVPVGQAKGTAVHLFPDGMRLQQGQGPCPASGMLLYECLTGRDER